MPTKTDTHLPAGEELRRYWNISVPAGDPDRYVTLCQDCARELRRQNVMLQPYGKADDWGQCQCRLCGRRNPQAGLVTDHKLVGARVAIEGFPNSTGTVLGIKQGLTAAQRRAIVVAWDDGKSHAISRGRLELLRA